MGSVGLRPNGSVRGNFLVQGKIIGCSSVGFGGMELRCRALMLFKVKGLGDQVLGLKSIGRPTNTGFEVWD